MTNKSRSTARNNPHHQLHYILDRGTMHTRKFIAKQLGMTRQALFDWEYQRTKVKDYMITDVARVAGFNMANMPPQLIQKDLDAVLNPKPKLPPPLPKLDYDAQVKADRAREERQAAKANDPKRHRIRNHGTPTKANKNPRTYSQFSTAMTDIVVKGRDIPSDMEYPDLVAAALDKLGFYEAVYVPAHTIPYVTGSARATLPFTRRTYPAFYWQRPNGVQSMADTIDEAKARIAQQIAEDEAATADLI